MGVLYAKVTGEWVATPGGPEGPPGPVGGVTDGDKGDVVVTAAGTVWTIEDTVLDAAISEIVSTDLVAGNHIALTYDAVDDELTISHAPLTAHLAAGTVIVNNSTTLTNTPLAVTVAASATYIVDGLIIVSADTTADVKFSFAVPAGTVFRGGALGAQVGAVNNATTSARWLGATESGTTLTGGVGAGTSPGANAVCCPLHGLLITSTTAGTVTLRLAQDTAHASDVYLFAGSYLRFTKIA